MAEHVSISVGYSGMEAAWLSLPFCILADALCKKLFSGALPATCKWALPSICLASDPAARTFERFAISDVVILQLWIGVHDDTHSFRAACRFK
jgi:hypothetical protein